MTRDIHRKLNKNKAEIRSKRADIGRLQSERFRLYKQLKIREAEKEKGDD